MKENKTQFQITEDMFSKKRRLDVNDFLAKGITRMSMYVWLMRKKYGKDAIQTAVKSNGHKWRGRYTFTHKR